jgi:hypothetical protein
MPSWLVDPLNFNCVVLGSNLVRAIKYPGRYFPERKRPGFEINKAIIATLCVLPGQYTDPLPFYATEFEALRKSLDKRTYHVTLKRVCTAIVTVEEE